jgi:hypothetical protein
MKVIFDYYTNITGRGKHFVYFWNITDGSDVGSPWCRGEGWARGHSSTCVS